MVRRLIYLFLLLPPFLFSGEFTASVNRNQINAGESFTLNLTLKDASARGQPSIGALKKSFIINSQHQSHNSVYMNGQMSSSITWKIALTPQREGETVIPPISIDTNEGTLSSDPIKILVVKGAAAGRSESSDTEGLTLTTDVSKAKPYKSEPFFYTIRLTSKMELANIKMQKVNMEDAIIEANGEPQVFKKFIDGKRVDIIEYSYLITPLKAGPLKIPSFVIQGGIPMRRRPHMGSFFDDDFDPVFMVQGFDHLKPFTLATEEIVLNVQPAVASVNPWLPAKSVKIEEIWNESQPLQAGEPLTRGFKIVAEGIKSSQLPGLNDLQISDNSFKIYADKPEMGEQIKDGNVKSFRKEQYTLIPQHAGALTLPEISLAWWDVTKNEKVVTRIPSRTLQILPATGSMQNNMTPNVDEDHTVPATQAAVIQRDPILYALIGGLAILLIGAIFWGIALQKKIMRLTEKPIDQKIADKREKAIHPQKSPIPKVKPPAKDKKEKLPDLNPS